MMNPRSAASGDPTGTTDDTHFRRATACGGPRYPVRHASRGPPRAATLRERRMISIPVGPPLAVGRLNQFVMHPAVRRRAATLRERRMIPIHVGPPLAVGHLNRFVMHPAVRRERRPYGESSPVMISPPFAASDPTHSGGGNPPARNPASNSNDASLPLHHHAHRLPVDAHPATYGFM